ncbi:MAG: phosphopentomutase [Thermodesulfobacteriota bacterium]|nr:phosphopentomutase [Thermodesulfobacteriota bacterium]
MLLNGIERVILITLDSVGIGELPDAEEYGDKGCNTLKNIADEMGGLELPNLEFMGLGLIENIKGLQRNIIPKAFFGKMLEASKGKDSNIGHWELSGIILDSHFPTFPNGYPDEVMEKFKIATGLDFLGNMAASGTEIIKSLGEEHLKTGKPIIYTSADSVFQIAAHEDMIPLSQLYDICRTAREILNPYRVLRVIARPFVGEPGNFRRTRARKDYSIPPPGKTVLDVIKENELPVIGIGKVGDIFANKGLSRIIPTENNLDGIVKTKKEMKGTKKGLIFTNLIDFDMIWGHRNDVNGYADGLKEFDVELPGILELLTEKDLLILTADHGCDPTTPGTDHSREYVPLLVYNPSCTKGSCLGVRQTFADVGQTITSALGLTPLDNGKSFFEKLNEEKYLD